MYYINDKVKEHFHNDDYFDGKEYVKKIKEAVQNTDIKSIGVYGKWGIGKTSIIKNTINELVAEGIYKENQIVEYNAWKYNKYDFMRDFLIVCSNKIEGESKAKDREESYYSDSSEDRQLYYMVWKKLWTFIKKSWQVLLFLLILYIICIIVIIYFNNLYPKIYDSADLITPLTLTLISFILPLFLVSEISHKSISRKFSPEQFARDFEEIVKNKKILIFIDDIDRCSSDEIKSTFDTLKTFILDESYNVKFIIPVDPNILLSSLDEKTYDYFSKIIDFSIEIKRYPKVMFEPLKNEILNDVIEEYKAVVSDGLYLASKFYIDTPRKMKKFANEFINEMYNYSPNEIIGKGYMFAKLIILKNEFPNYYQNLIRNYNAINEVTKSEILRYSSYDYKESTEQKQGIIFSTNLLDFLSKTDSVDLHDFPMYESKISYSEYKIKAICEEPFTKNKFDENIKVDLKENETYLNYELTENIINPLLNGRFLYNEPLKIICFLFTEFEKQKNCDVLKKYFDTIINNFDVIENDKNLFISKNDVLVLNVSYIQDCLKEYVQLVREKNEKLLDYNLIKKVLEYVQNNICDKFELIEDDLIEFVKIFKYEKNIDDLNLIEIIENFLSNNFEKYHREFDWYLKYSPKSGNNCYVINIIELLKKNANLNIELIENYLNERYLTINTSTYFNCVSQNIKDILLNPNGYKCILNPLINNFDVSNIQFEELERVIYETNYLSDSDIINEFILIIIKQMKNSEGYNEEKYKLHIKELGIQYEKSDKINESLKKFLKNCNEDDKYTILNYDNENKIFENFNVLKKSELMFNNNVNDPILEILCNTYCKYEDFVIEADMERHGINLSNIKSEVKKIIKENINKTLYLASEFSEEDVKSINFESLNVNEIHFKYISNKYILSKITELLIKNIDDSIKKIKLNKDDKELIKKEVDKLLLSANQLYAEIGYSDKTLWTKLKKINEFLALNEMLCSYYIPKLKEYPGLINLFKVGKYKDNYMKNNVYADKILIGIGLKEKTTV